MEGKTDQSLRQPHPPVHSLTLASLADVRTSYIRFLLAFLKQGDGAVKKFMLEAKDLLSAIFKGMSEDSYEVINTSTSIV